MKYVKLDEEFRLILCCPICKARLESVENGFVCKECGTKYLHSDGVYDFRIHRPKYCLPLTQREYHEKQSTWEDFSANYLENDCCDVYLKEIDSVREIYTQEFSINDGKVIDIGGYIGTLRHFLNNETLVN